MLRPDAVDQADADRKNRLIQKVEAKKLRILKRQIQPETFLIDTTQKTLPNRKAKQHAIKYENWRTTIKTQLNSDGKSTIAYKRDACVREHPISIRKKEKKNIFFKSEITRAVISAARILIKLQKIQERDW